MARVSTAPNTGDQWLDTALQLSEDMTKKPGANRDHDQVLHNLFTTGLSIESPRLYTADFNAAMSIKPKGWWWHISHLEANVSPTYDVAVDVPISNSADYHFNGRVLDYSSMIHGHENLIPFAICEAVLLAHISLKLKKLSVERQRYYIVQTGNGPKLADPATGGSLIDMPTGSWLDDDGQLIARKDAFPEYKYIEALLDGDDAEEDNEGDDDGPSAES